MRMMMRIAVPTEAGNAGIANGTFGPTLQAMLEDLKPEASYFVAENGVRTAYLFVNMTESSQLPAFAEPSFLAYGAKVEITPAMNVDDLKAAMPALEQAAKKYAKSK